MQSIHSMHSMHSGYQPHHPGSTRRRLMSANLAPHSKTGQRQLRHPSIICHLKGKHMIVQRVAFMTTGKAHRSRAYHRLINRPLKLV